MEACFVWEARVDECGEVVEDAADAADGEFEGVSAGEWGVDVAVVGAVEGFFEEVAF